MRPRLVLFDIDGTLLSAGGVSARSLEGALLETFGTRGPTADFEYSGKTDPQIVRELMWASGFSDVEIEERIALALERYHRRLEAAITPADVEAKPGALTLVEALAIQPAISLGLLTGNLEPCARLKLAQLGANHFFSFGAYGSDNEDRYRLPSLAIERARAAAGIDFDGSQVVIVGDSVHDVLCGRSLGVRAVAVATGRTSPSRLADAGPDALLTDFTDTRASLSAILLTGDSWG